MADTGTKLTGGTKLVAVAATRERLTTTPLEFAAKTVIVQALSTNEGLVVVGGEDVVAKAAAHEAASTRIGIALAANESIAIDIDDPQQVWLDTTKNKEGVNYTVLHA